MIVVDQIVKLVPVGLRERLGWKLLRSASPSDNAFAHIFVEPYHNCAN